MRSTDHQIKPRSFTDMQYLYKSTAWLTTGGRSGVITTLACDESHPVILQNACTSSTCSNNCHPVFNTWADASRII